MPGLWHASSGHLGFTLAPAVVEHKGEDAKVKMWLPDELGHSNQEPSSHVFCTIRALAEASSVPVSWWHQQAHCLIVCMCDGDIERLVWQNLADYECSRQGIGELGEGLVESVRHLLSAHQSHLCTT